MRKEEDAPNKTRECGEKGGGGAKFNGDTTPTPDGV